jgi:hypothetical protein
MSNASNKPTIGFWIISVTALIWNLIGANQYLQQAYKTESFRDMYTDEQFEIILSTPSWAIAAFAVAVFGGAFGCILLILRKRLAKFFFMASLFGIVVQMIYNLFIVEALEVYGPGAIIMPIMVIAVGFFLVWYSKRAIDKGWIS